MLWINKHKINGVIVLKTLNMTVGTACREDGSEHNRF
jgi:hypothetical protein